MAFIGKLACGFIGFRILGIPGLLVGLLLGHLVDDQDSVDGIPNAFRNVKRSKRDSAKELEEQHYAYFVGVFSMLAKLAKADGHISAHEIRAVEIFMEKDLRLDYGRMRLAKNIFRSAKASKRTFEEHAREFYQVFQHDRPVLNTVLDVLLRVSLADGSMNAAEENLIRQATRIFGLPDEQYTRSRSQYDSNPDKNYSILGLSKDATPGQIKKKYRQLVLENHPDRVASKGQPAEFVKIATERFRAIQAAYEAIKAEKGFS